MTDMKREAWKAKQVLAGPSRYYGDGGTIHSTTYLDIETDLDGRVVAVWFRCQQLPFRQTFVDDERAARVRRYEVTVSLTGVEVLDG